MRRPLPAPHTRAMVERFAGLLALLSLLAMVWGCKQRPPKVPGETDVEVKEVEIEPMDEGKKLELPHEELFERLGERPGSLILNGRMWSPFREAEDRRRIEAYWQQRGYFDVDVAPAIVTFDKDKAAHIRFKLRENRRYKVGKIEIKSAPPLPDGEKLDDLVYFKTGYEDIDLEKFRHVRVDMQERLRAHGYGHANAYSRVYVDKGERVVHVVFFVDTGPKTKIASIKVTGAVKIKERDVVRRSGLKVGQPYSEDLRDRVVRDLLDTGAYASAFVRVDTDTKFIIPGSAPDTGGDLRDEQVDASGNLVPRTLPEGINVTIHVVEAPSQTLKLRAGFEIDPARADTILTATLWLRNLLGPMQHVVLEGRAGYGYIFDRDTDEPPGFYGEALIRTIHPGALGRTGDLRTTIRYVGSLYPHSFLHRGTTGIGARTSFLQGLYLDVDVLAYFEKTEKFGPFSTEEREALALASRDLAIGPEVDAAFVWDGRDNPIEPLRGSYVALTSRIDPLDIPGGVADYPFVNLGGDVRGFIPLTASLSIALRAYGEWSLLDAGDGIPLGERLFGGGNYGFRGFGAQHLSPMIIRCFQDFCREIPVGGRSLIESSAEVRFLPLQKPYGAGVFVDLGGAGGDLNPFPHGPSLAAGVGLRLRLWYLPAAIDVAYRILDDGAIQGIDTQPFRVFFRIGEAF